MLSRCQVSILLNKVWREILRAVSYFGFRTRLKLALRFKDGMDENFLFVSMESIILTDG